MKVVDKTTNSINVEVKVKDSNNVSYTFSYKKNNEEEWNTLEETNNNVTINNLEANVVYNIRVLVTNSNGSTQKTINVLTGELPTGTITFGDVVWENGSANVVVNTSAEGYTLQHRVGASGEWQEISNGEKISNLKYGDTVYARLWDGVNGSETASLDIADDVEPIVDINVTSSSPNSIQISVNATDNQSGMMSSLTYNYYIKQSSNADYELKDTSASNTYTFTGLIQNTDYDVKVEVASDIAGNNGIGYSINQRTGTMPGGDTGIETGAITFGNTSWNLNQASITVNTNTNYQIQYQKNSISGTWNNIDNGGTISGLKYGETVYARLSDGINVGDYASASISDDLLPESAVITLSGGGTVTQNPTVNARIKQTDNQSGVNIARSKWVLNTSSAPLGENPDNYSGGSFSSEDESINVPINTEGNNYLHILTIDNAGKAKETISQAINMTINRHHHTGSSTSGGGCYVSVPHTVTRQCNETVTMRREGDQWDTGSCMAGGVAGYCSKGHKVTGQVTWGYGTSWTGTVQGTCRATYTETTYTYELGCGMSENQILSYTISY